MLKTRNFLGAAALVSVLSLFLTSAATAQSFDRHHRGGREHSRRSHQERHHFRRDHDHRHHHHHRRWAWRRPVIIHHAPRFHYDPYPYRRHCW